MKPTFQISRPARRGESERSLSHPFSKSLATDWSFQSGAAAMRGGAGAFHRASKPSFRSLSQEFFAAEARQESRLEGAVFGVIVALAAWPIGLAVQAAIVLTK